MSEIKSYIPEREIEQQEAQPIPIQETENQVTDVEVVLEEKEEKITKLIIEKEHLKWPSVIDEEDEILVKKLSLARNYQDYPNRPISYYNLHNLSNTQKLEIFMREGNELKKIALPEKMLERVAIILANEKEIQQKFDCWFFACYANQAEYTPYETMHNNWKAVDPDNINPGDTIMISVDGKTKASAPTHFAIYLGDGLYISKAGYAGRLMVADLDEMVKCFGGDYYTKLVLKSQAEKTEE